MSACFQCNEPLHNCVCPPGSQSPKGLCAPSPTIVEMSPEEIQAAFPNEEVEELGLMVIPDPDKERPSDKGATVDYQTGLSLALIYLHAPMVDPGYPSVKKPALALLNEWLEVNGYEEVK